MKKRIYKQIRLMLIVGICIMLMAIVFPTTIGTQINTKDSSVINGINPILLKILASYKLLNWNFWENPPHIFSRNEGNVGIGTTSPQSKLDVSGTVTTSGDYKYTSPKTYYLFIPTAAFVPGSPEDFNYLNFGDFITQYTFESTVIKAPVNLPQGATVTEFSTYAFDYDAGYNIQLESILFVRNILSIQLYGMSDIYLVTSGSSTDIQSTSDSSIENATIDNQNYQYHIQVVFNAHCYGNTNLRFYGCRIAYTMDTIAP